MISRNFNFLIYSKKGLRLIWPILGVVLLIVIGEVLFVDPFGRLLSILGLSKVTSTIAQNWSESLGGSLKRIFRSIAVVVSILLVLKHLLNKSHSYIGIDFSKKRLKDVFIGIGFGFLVQIISIILMKSFGWFELTGYSWNFHPSSFFLPAILFLITYCIETGIIEEIIFRGFLLRIFEDRYSTKIAVIVSSAFFGLMHFSGLNNEFAWWMSIISSFAVGLVFTQAFLFSRSLWLPFGFHAGWHLAMSLLGSDGLNYNEAIFLVTKVSGPAFFVSTKAGGAGLFELIGVLTVSLILYLIQKRFAINI